MLSLSVGAVALIYIFILVSAVLMLKWKPLPADDPPWSIFQIPPTQKQQELKSLHLETEKSHYETTHWT